MDSSKYYQQNARHCVDKTHTVVLILLVFLFLINSKTTYALSYSNYLEYCESFYHDYDQTTTTLKQQFVNVNFNQSLGILDSVAIVIRGYGILEGIVNSVGISTTSETYFHEASVNADSTVFVDFGPIGLAGFIDWVGEYDGVWGFKNHEYAFAHVDDDLSHMRTNDFYFNSQEYYSLFGNRPYIDIAYQINTVWWGTTLQQSYVTVTWQGDILVTYNYHQTPVPEPTAALLFGTGLLVGFAGFSRDKKKLNRIFEKKSLLSGNFLQ